MRRLGVLTSLLLLLMLAIGDGAGYARPAEAQSLAGASQDCGTYTFHEDLIKGRAHGEVVYVHHTVGGWIYDYTNNVPGDGISKTQLERDCVDDGRDAAVGHFRWYRGIEINRDDVKVTCSPYSGPD
jgi:hypothetical protein